MKITYNVYRRFKGKTASQNGSLDLPEYTSNDWPKVSVRTKIRDKAPDHLSDFGISGTILPLSMTRCSGNKDKTENEYGMP